MPPGEGSDPEGPGAIKVPVQVTADDLADEEWGPVKQKKKKDKKGKDKKGKSRESEDEEKGEGEGGEKCFFFAKYLFVFITCSSR